MDCSYDIAYMKLDLNSVCFFVLSLPKQIGVGLVLFILVLGRYGLGDLQTMALLGLYLIFDVFALVGLDGNTSKSWTEVVSSNCKVKGVAMNAK